ncbi:hypothetical protein OPIT5_12575 [Opitutaceae bacterium TAV5]|nr:hypothetical protein OPIT5_12575 [Opitutaceae bacterium TAV5]
MNYQINITAAAILTAAVFFTNSVHASDSTDVSRAASWTASGTDGFSGNGHGSTLAPTDSIWSYYYQAGYKTGSGSIYTLDPQDWIYMPWSSSYSRFAVNATPSSPDGASANANTGYVRATESALSIFWNSPGNPSVAPEDAFRPPWLIAAYTATADTEGVYDIGGSLSWTLEKNAGANGARIVIGVVRQGTTTATTLETLLSLSNNTTALGTYTLFDGSVEMPVPNSLTGITLNEGDQLFIALRGANSQNRTLTLNDSALTLTFTAVPEPAAAAILAGASIMTIASLVRRRSATTREGSIDLHSGKT